MEQLPSQVKTPNRTPKHQLPSSNSPNHLSSPHSAKVCLPQHPTHIKEEPQRTSETKMPVVYRKHSYINKEFTQIHDLETGTRTTRSKAPIKLTLSDFNEIAEIGPYMINVSALNPEPAYKKSEWKELNSTQKYCCCTKSECLKNYCCCRQRGQYCAPQCTCANCKNILRQQSEEEQARSRSREQAQGTRRLQENDLGWTNVCACRRNKNCSKLYCGCLKVGINCSKNCKCFNCKN